MPRIIDPFPARSPLDLDGLWELIVGDDARPPRRSGERIAVPGVWETALDHADRRGVAWFVRDLVLPHDCPAGARLVFGAVSHTAEVWFDGRRVGGHYGAHTEFACELPPLRAGAHRVAVRVDNRFGDGNPLSGPWQDIYTWGGITRSVRLERLGAARIEAPALVPRRTRRGWEVAVAARVQGAGQVELRLDGRVLGTLPVRRGRVAGALPAGTVRTWSPADPALHLAELRAGDDLFRVRLGFRTIAVRGRRILLNGRPLTLVGVNRHEFHPDHGPCVPTAIQLKDLAILRRLGANFVRGSHYPNDPAFLDLCDEHGLLFWDELSHWQPKEKDLRSPAFRAASLAQAEEMVVQHRHHPSILCWGFLNECDSHTAAARPVVRELARRIRSLDPTRPITFASHKPFDDRCYDLVDIVSVNTYPGWYGGDLADLADRRGFLHGKLLPAIRRRSLGKPVIISEFGGGAMDGVRSFELRKWTEGYQAELLDRLIAAWQDSGFISGLAIWQFCDARTSAGMAMVRIREYNNKGLLTEYRQPKESFQRVREAFRRRWAIDG